MKKVLSIALALVMVISCFAVSAFAVIDNAELAITIKPTSTTFAKGDIVTFEVCYEASDDLVKLGVTYGMEIGFDSSVFEPIETLSGLKTLNNATTVILTGYPAENNVLLPMSNVSIITDSNLSATDKAKGWNAVMRFSMASILDDPVADCDDDYSTEKASWAFQLKVKDDAEDGNYTVGITDYSWNVEELLMVNETNGALFGNDSLGWGLSYADMFACTDAEVTVGAAEEYKVFDGAVKIRKNADDNTKYDLGFTGSFEDFDPDFNDKGTSASIKNVGCEVTINGVTKTYYDRFIYEGTSYGKYAFRVAVGAFGPLDETEVSIRMFVELNEAVDGQTIFYSKGITTTMNEQIQARDS